MLVSKNHATWTVRQFEHQNVANTRKMRGSNSNMLQNTVEMAASSSKMLQIARTRTGQVKSPRLRLDRGSATTAAAVISEGKVYAEPRWNHLVMVNTSKSSSLRDSNQESTATSSQICFFFAGFQACRKAKSTKTYLFRASGMNIHKFPAIFAWKGPSGKHRRLDPVRKNWWMRCWDHFLVNDTGININ